MSRFFFFPLSESTYFNQFEYERNINNYFDFIYIELKLIVIYFLQSYVYSLFCIRTSLSQFGLSLSTKNVVDVVVGTESAIFRA